MSQFVKFLSNNKKGFIQIPILLGIIGLVIIGTYTATQLPQILEEREFKKISQQSNIPVGTASAEEILVGFQINLSPINKDGIHDQAQAEIKKRIDKINVDTVRVPTGVSVQELIEKYQNLPGVEYVEPNFIATAFLTPNDPLYSQQWNLEKILSVDSYEIAQGGYGPIAIIDTGVDSSHPDLSGLVLEGYNAITKDNNSNDDHGHGTHVAGIASAQTNNSTGIASISYQSTILPVKVLNSDGIGTYDDVAEGIIYAADKSRIINLSLGGSSDSKTLQRAVDYAHNQGSVLIASAGNNGNNAPVYPASYSGVLAISASDKNDNLASFSSYGSNIFAAAPGVSITSTTLGSKYNQASGTSMSAPHVSGLIALSLSADGTLTNNQIVELIKNNTDKVGSYSYNQDGWNQYFGYGRINAGKTLQAVAELDYVNDIDETTLTPTTEPTLSEPQPEKTQVPEEYSFNFELQGEVNSIDSAESKLNLKLDGGTPNVINLISGNLVDVFVENSTRIIYQGNNINLEEIIADSKLNVKGNIVQNKLIALEIMVQYMPSDTPTQPEEIKEPTEERKTQPDIESSVENQQTPSFLEKINPRNRVRGARTISFWKIIENKIYQIFGL